MKKTLPMVIITVMIALLWACSTGSIFKTNQMYHGFRLVEKRFVEEVNAECLYFIHEKSGARLMKIAANDPNKMFNIAFKTLPETDYGTPHILEHAVLNGSKNFPVKSPFDVLVKGSLNTFLNAMTGSDMTTYPVASMNEKDYFNLMHVYLDAVFNPRIYDDPRILQQEGWHYELDDLNSDLVIRGVVYNEMKGAFSSPMREHSYQVYKILFPDNTYGVSSGGYPQAIPGLTQEYFEAFHAKFYHPSNSYIMLYGDADLTKELEFIDREYLSAYDRSDAVIDVALQQPFEAMKEAQKPYAVPAGSSTQDNTYLSMSFVAGECIDREMVMAFNVLTSALVNHESAPVRKALQEAKIGKDIRASYNTGRQNVFQILVQNANPEDKDRFREIVLSTIADAIKTGLDKTMLEGIINRMEFNMREGNTPQKGLMYAMAMNEGWMFANDPWMGLEYEKPLSALKTALTTNKLEELAQNYIIDNPHALLMALVPQPGLENEINNRLRTELAQYKKTLTNEQLLEIVQNTKDLLAYQKTEDTPEALATIPMLQLADISPEPEWYEVKEKTVDGIKILHTEEFTSRIIYSNLYFDLRVLPQELIPYSQILSTIMGKLNTKNYGYGDLENELNIHIGGFNTYTSQYLEDLSGDKLIPKFVVSAKSTHLKADKKFELMKEIISHSIYSDKDRLKSLLTRHQSRVDAQVKNNGMEYAMTRLSSYYSQQGMYNEITSGLEYYYFITNLVKDFDNNADEIIANIEKTASLLFNQNNLIASVTGSNDDYKVFKKHFGVVLAEMPQSNADYTEWNFDLQKQNEGLLTASKVQYVIQGFDFKQLGYKWNGTMRVLNQILSRDHLQTQVRVIGGAYGGFTRISPSGNIHFASYRDPNLVETLAAYKATLEFLESFAADESAMTRFIIGTIAGMDRPTTPSQRGNIAVQRYFEKVDYAFMKKERTEILNTKVEDIKAMKQMVADVLAQEALCVYGAEEKIRQNSQIFSKLVSLAN
jgi:presequence protease